MRSLLIGDINDRYVIEFVTEILDKRDGWEFDILSVGGIRDVDNNEMNVTHLRSVHYIEHKHNLLLCGKHVGKIWDQFIGYSICNQYDEIIIYNVDIMSFAAAIFAKRNSKIVLCYFGSDLLRAGKMKLFILKHLVKRATFIVVENEFMKENFEIKYGSKNAKKIRYAHFGTKNAEIMLNYFPKETRAAKRHFNIEEDKLVVFVGYNGGRSQNHIEVLDILSSLPKNIKNQLFVVLHCAYGLDDNYGNILKDKLAETGIDGRIVTEYMVGNQLAEFRCCGDIMINWQPTDCMSASMIENMEAGVIVINGSWLIYPDIVKYGGYFETAATGDELKAKIIDIVNSLADYKKKTSVNSGIMNILKWNYDEWNNVLEKTK